MYIFDLVQDFLNHSNDSSDATVDNFDTYLSEHGLSISDVDHNDLLDMVKNLQTNNSDDQQYYGILNPTSDPTGSNSSAVESFIENLLVVLSK